MRQLIKFEVFKIVKRKSSLIAIIASLVVTFALSMLTVFTFGDMDFANHNFKQGPAAIARVQKREGFEPKILSDAFITESIKAYQAVYSQPENLETDKYGNQVLIKTLRETIEQPRYKMYDLIVHGYHELGDNPVYSQVLELDMSQGARFYAAIKEKEKYALSEFYSGHLSQKEKTFWQNKSEQVKTPYRFGYYEGWTEWNRTLIYFILTILVICIIIAPVFAGEYQSGADAIILSAKYGKSKNVTAKIIASNLVAFAVFTMNICLSFALVFGFLGTAGWNLPVQVLGATVPFAMNLLQLTLLNIGIAYLVMFAFVAFTLFLSSKLKTPFLVLIVVLPLIFMPIFINLTDVNYLFDAFLNLLPAPCLTTNLEYFDYQIGPIMLDLFSMRAILYLLLVPVLTFLSRKGFVKHEVG